MTSTTPAGKGDLTPEERVMLQVAASGTGNHCLVSSFFVVFMIINLGANFL